MTLRGMLGGHVQHMQEQIDDLLDREHGLIVLFDGSRMVSPWRCHRSLIADALVARGIEASEITSGVSTRPHSLTPWAQVTSTQVTYPGAGDRSGQSEPGALRTG